MLPQELEPSLVATTTSKPFGFEGHPFIVEAGVSLGGKLGREGITVHRFANRIPLLFEAGGDVVTKMAHAISYVRWHLAYHGCGCNTYSCCCGAVRRWSHYKIDQKKEKIGVFVSIVSTKVPFKGTGKEFIGSDIVEIANAVKRALQARSVDACD